MIQDYLLFLLRHIDCEETWECKGIWWFKTWNVCSGICGKIKAEKCTWTRCVLKSYFVQYIKQDSFRETSVTDVRYGLSHNVQLLCETGFSYVLKIPVHFVAFYMSICCQRQSPCYMIIWLARQTFTWL